jgi:hypothetical protein
MARHLTESFEEAPQTAMAASKPAKKAALKAPAKKMVAAKKAAPAKKAASVPAKRGLRTQQAA